MSQIEQFKRAYKAGERSTRDTRSQGWVILLIVLVVICIREYLVHDFNALAGTLVIFCVVVVIFLLRRPKLQ